ncbi:hypothetical protein GIB67_023012 [Kingdonia uniflora]|uniref:Uncharacterized protein n=1 Tax=Kingdonia uniflora TaxID=39325 RepID=A0A7J7P2V6_9MAGN|nr:hypothetical protein GIB67_023012 [Kingdonia uniflora]
MTQTLDDVEQLVGFPADGDATVIGGTWGFPTILEVFENNLLQDLKAFKSLKAGGADNSLSMKKLKSHYAYKLEKVLSDGTAATAKKKKGLSARSVARAYMLFVLGSFLFPTKKGTNVSVRYLVLFAKDKSWIFAHFPKLGGIPKEMDSDAYEHCTCWKWDVSVTNRYGGIALLNFREALDNYKLEDHHEHSSRSPNINLNDQQITALNDQLQKLKEDKEKESKANINLRDALKEKAEIELKRAVDKQCALEFADLPKQLDAKILEGKNLEEKNTNLEAELRQKSGLEDCNQSLFVELNKKCKEIESLKTVNAFLIEQKDLQLPPATPLVVLQSHQPMSDTTLTRKYEDLLAAHENIKKKLIAKEDFVGHSK